METEDQKQQRNQHNKEILDKLKKGESTQLIPTHMTWFPPRPIIKKDEKHIKELYGEVKIVGDQKEKDNPT